MAKKNNPKAEKAKRNLEYARIHKKRKGRPTRFGRPSGPPPGPRPPMGGGPAPEGGGSAPEGEAPAD